MLLAHGAAKVHAVDVGHGQLAWKLRPDPRVVVHEKTNARYLARDAIVDPIGALVCDASFIGLRTLLPAPLALCAPGAWAVALIKPQFEAGPEAVGSKGVVRDPAVHQAVCDRIHAWWSTLPGWGVLGIIESPITGSEGNREYLIARHQELTASVTALNGVSGDQIALRDLGQERPHLGRFHRYVRIVQQAIEFVEFPGVLGVRHFCLSSRVGHTEQPKIVAVLRRDYGDKKLTNELPGSEAITPTIVSRDPAPPPSRPDARSCEIAAHRPRPRPPCQTVRTEMRTLPR